MGKSGNLEWRRSWFVGIVTAGLALAPAWGVDPSQRTADMPDSWLVLYNNSSPESRAWGRWYRLQYGIPERHLLGLNASLSEHLPDLATARAQVLDPVRNFLAANPDIEQKLMGIVVGYRLPSHFGNPPNVPSVGGFSIANALQDLSTDTSMSYNPDCPHMWPPYVAMPPEGRLTKASLATGHYIVGQIDGPTLNDAIGLTARAKIISLGVGFGRFERVWFDYTDSAMPGGIWVWLRRAVESPDLAEVPWSAFDSDTEQTPDDAIRLETHDVDGWNDPRLFGQPPGSRVLAFNFNSWGATTIRSRTAEGGRYVPNALAAGYAAAIGATGEPICCLCPFPDTLMLALQEGWTLGEAFYLSNPYDNWMWTLVGDPLLAVPTWFADVAPEPGDIDGDGMVNLQDYSGFRACAGGPGVPGDPVCDAFDFDRDGDRDLRDFAEFQAVFTGGAVTPPSGDFDNDGDVDAEDFQAQTVCLTSPGPTSLQQGCDTFDFTFDLDVDLEDYAQFQSICQGDDRTNPKSDIAVVEQAFATH